MRLIFNACKKSDRTFEVRDMFNGRYYDQQTDF